MQLVFVEGIDPAGIEHAVDSGSYAKGVQYAQQHAVLHMEWDDAERALQGAVRGSEGRQYTTVVYFTIRSGSDLEFEFAECSCPVGVDCKHAVALALTATGATRPRTRQSKTGTSRSRPAVEWERSLGSLLQPDPGGSGKHSGATALAIELTLSGVVGRGSGRAPAPGAGPKLLARLVRPGRAGWVYGGLSWSAVGSLHYYGEYRASHVRLLQELYALYRSGTHHYSYGEDTTIDLAVFGSRQLWPMLDEAAAIGVQIVYGRKGLGAVEKYGQAELCLDVTGREQPDSLAVTPVLRVGGTGGDAVPVRFIGAEGHGVVYLPDAPVQGRADPGDCCFRLARLARPVPPALQRMALEGRHLEIPVDEQDRFRDTYYPRLRHLAPVGSSDESFTPPTISDPTLVLRACYGTGHDLGISWEWAYQVGDSQMRAPMSAAQGGAEDGYRDPAKERELLEELDVPLDRFGLRGDNLEQGLLPRAALGGLDTMRFTTEALPLLADAPGVAVEVDGEPADYREASDSLRIGLSTDDVAGETDWFDLGVSITVEGRDIPFADVFVALASEQTHLLLPDGAYFSLQKPELQALRRLIEEARALQDAPEGRLRISRFQAGLWDELTELGVVDRQAKAWQQQVTGLLSLDSVPATRLPDGMTATLRPYQRAGFGWLAFLWQFRLGGILADDMGLGKTLQSLTLICHAKQTDPAISPFLIVAPTSVVSNWPAEAARFAPGLTVVPICDTLRRRGQDLDEIIAGADVVVTSYTLFRLDFEAYAAADWSGLILDEAQHTKNHQSKIYQCARKLAAPFKLAITGTPMENNLMELWSLLSITAPGLFPSPARFRDYYARSIEKQGDTERLGQLRRRVRPLVTRRTKELVAADLPDKQEQVLEVELEPRHRAVYQRHLQRERQKVLGLIDDVNRNRFTILRSLTLLRQLSLHAGLIDPAHGGLPSSKIDVLAEQLGHVINGGHRALVFSQFTGFLAEVRERLDAEGIPYSYLDGSTRNRPAVVQRFKDGAVPVFLISLKAGGFGLNLTEADYCFLLDPWWNPATEAQAVDRTHRIGQTRNVMVYRLIAKDTIEEKVRALAERKAELFTGVMDEGNVFGSALDAEDIRALLA